MDLFDHEGEYVCASCALKFTALMPTGWCPECAEHMAIKVLDNTHNLAHFFGYGGWHFRQTGEEFFDGAPKFEIWFGYGPEPEDDDESYVTGLSWLEAVYWVENKERADMREILALNEEAPDGIESALPVWGSWEPWNK